MVLSGWDATVSACGYTRQGSLHVQKAQGGATPKTFREGVLEEGQWTGAISAGICWFVNRRDDLSLGECQGLFSKTLFSFSVLTLSFTESLYILSW